LVPARDIASGVRDGTLDALQVTREHLQRIADVDGTLHAFTAVREEAAMADAARIASSPHRSTLPLAGVPVAVKDNFHVAGLPTRHGSRATPATPATADSEAVRRLRAAGAVIIGKTAMPELAIWPFTEGRDWVTRNPVDPSRTCGGSSGGSAVAVASGMAALALGTDSGGSIRIPAACCGVAGVKPTPGVVPLPHDAAEHWFALTAAGALARDVRDAWLMLGVLGGEDSPASPRAAHERVRVAVSVRHPMLAAPVHPSVVSAVRHVAHRLADAGHHVDDEDPPYPALPFAFLRPYLAGIAADAAELSLDLDGAEPRTRQMVRLGGALRRAFGDRSAQASPAARRLRRWCAQRDVVLTPVLAYPPPPAGRWGRGGWLATALSVARWMGFAPPWNLAGCPAVVVPVASAGGSLPVGVQLVAAPGREPLLLDIAARIEAMCAPRG
jgi:amidase